MALSSSNPLIVAPGQSSTVPGQSSDIIDPANTASPLIVAEPMRGCGFEYDDGRKCLDLKLFARGLCGKHYSQLRRAGAFAAKGTADVLDVVGEVERLRLDKALSILQRASPHLARLVVKASKVAADKGDVKPAAWGLLHSRAIQPLAKDAQVANLAPTINIGFALAGIPTTSGIATTTEDR
jgi:hypothetical protein